LPFCFYMVISSWEYTHNSWKLLEGSAEAGGLPFVYILKTLIPVMPALLALQALVVVLTSIQTLTKQHS